MPIYSVSQAQYDGMNASFPAGFTVGWEEGDPATAWRMDSDVAAQLLVTYPASIPAFDLALGSDLATFILNNLPIVVFDESIGEVMKSLSRLEANTFELWLKAGQSNSVGVDGTNGTYFSRAQDRPQHNIYELSQGINKDTYNAAPVGTLQQYRNPAQDDTDNIGFGFHFAKHRLRLNPQIKYIVIVNRGVGGTGFSDNRWNPGDDLYNLAVDDMNLAIQNYPELVPTGIIWHQGEKDNSQTQAFYETALAAMVSGMRSDITNGGNMKFILGTMVESWIAADEPNRRPIDLAHRNVESYIENATFVDFSDLTDLENPTHFTSGSLREMGKRYAEQVAKIRNANFDQFTSHRLRVIDKKVVDVFNGNHREFNATVFNDATRGYVIDISEVNGFDCSLQLNPAQYTKAAWFNRTSVFAGFNNAISGNISNIGNDNRHYFGYGGVGHGNPFSAMFTTEIQAAMVLNTWVHLCVAWDGTNMHLWVNGVADVSNPLAYANSINDPTTVQIGMLVNANMFGGLLDDVMILPYAVDDAGALAIYNETL